MDLVELLLQVTIAGSTQLTRIDTLIYHNSHPNNRDAPKHRKWPGCHVNVSIDYTVSDAVSMVTKLDGRQLPMEAVTQ